MYADPANQSGANVKLVEAKRKQINKWLASDDVSGKGTILIWYYYTNEEEQEEGEEEGKLTSYVESMI